MVIWFSVAFGGVDAGKKGTIFSVPVVVEEDEGSPSERESTDRNLLRPVVNSEGRVGDLTANHLSATVGHVPVIDPTAARLGGCAVWLLTYDFSVQT